MQDIRKEFHDALGESRGESTTFQKNVILKDNVLDRDIFSLWSKTHKCGLSIPSGIFYKCKTTSVSFHFEHKLYIVTFDPVCWNETNTQVGQK